MKSILGNIVIMVVITAIVVVVLVVIKGMQESDCADMGARRVAVSGDRGLGYVCVGADGRIVQK